MTIPPNETSPLSLADVLEEEAALLHGERPERSDASADARLHRWRAQIHARHPKQAGLCLSGGGIRSATFGLGVLQSLAKLQLLDKFDYVSTVSGGGYIGSWLTSWIHRHPRGMAGVVADLRRHTHPGSSDAPPAVQWLRTYSNYLSPHLGFLSADSWTLIGIYLRNLHLNWMVLLPLLMIPLLFPRGIIALSQLNQPNDQLPPLALPTLVAAGLGSAVMAMIYLHLCRPTLSAYRQRSPWHRLEPQAWFLKGCLAPLIIAAICLTTAWAWFLNQGGSLTQLTLYHTVMGATILHTGSWLFAAVALKRFQTFSRWLLYETGAVAATGALGGWFLWQILAMTPQGVPVADHAEWSACFAVPGVLVMFLLTATIFIGLSSRFTEEEDREWWGRAGSWVLLVIVVWIMLHAIVIFGPGLVTKASLWIAGPLGILAGLLTLSLGFSARSSAQQGEERSHSTVLTDLLIRSATPLFMLGILIALTLGGSLLLNELSQWFGPALITLAGPHSHPVGELMPADGWNHSLILHHTPLSLAALSAALLAGLGLIMARFVNINRFSLHAMYRNRLIRAYLGASRARADREQTFNPFTGFDDRDNPDVSDLRLDGVRLARRLYDSMLPAERRVRLEEFSGHRAPPADEIRALRDELRRDLIAFLQIGGFDQLSETLRLGPAAREHVKALQAWRIEAPHEPSAVAWVTNLFINGLHRQSPRPLHLINIALNLVKGDNLAWQQRKAQSFTVSALHSGSWNLGYRRSEEYAANQHLDHGFSLGTAMAISGAAASPNMGYHSSSAVTFLLTLFNIRLGWWLGNPGPAGASTYRQASPNFSVGPLFDEAFGLTDAQHPYVYLSDGGHFENLGLYELVLRRCHCILVVDAGCDPTATFEDLGNAIRKIRIDLGIDIQLDVDELRRLPGQKTSRRHHAIGLIRYDKADANATAGTLLYLKPSLTGREPSDVQDYAVRRPAFPHEPTSDQFFDESQFESYRRLGECIAEEVLRPAVQAHEQDIPSLCRALRAHWVSTPPTLQTASLNALHDLGALERLLRDDPELLRYDLEIYPELRTVLGLDPPDAALDPRAALHTCTLQLRFMEQVYVALQLNEFHAHTLNRGWMNLFRRWTSPATLRRCWPILCGQYSGPFVRFADQHLNLPLTSMVRLEPMEPAGDPASFHQELSNEWAPLSDYAERFKQALAQPIPLDDTAPPGRRGAWQMRLAGSTAPGENTPGQILAVVAVTKIPGTDSQLALYGWVRPAYRGLGLGRRLFGTALAELSEAYPRHRISVDLGPDYPTWAGTSTRNVEWLRFYEQLGFTRDRSDPNRFCMSKHLS